MPDEPARRTFDLRITDCGRPEDGDPLLRLRALLKAMLRGYHYRCVRVAEVKPAPAANAPGPPSDADAPRRP